MNLRKKMLEEAELKELVTKINRAIKSGQLSVVTEYYLGNDVADTVTKEAELSEQGIQLNLRGTLTPGKRLSLNDWFKGHRDKIELTLKENIEDGEKWELKDFVQVLYLECYDGQLENDNPPASRKKKS